MDEMNREKFQSLSRKSKIQWLLEYYGVKAVIGVVVLIVLISFFKSVFFSQKYDANVMILDTRMGRDESVQLQQDLEQVLQGKKIRYCSYTKSDENQMQAFSIRVMSDHLDMLIVPETEALELLRNGYWLEEPVELTATSNYEKYRAALDKMENPADIYYEKLYIGIPADCKQEENGRKLLSFLLQE